MNRILLVGNGAREHAIAESLCMSDNVELFVFMSRMNPGIKGLTTKYKIGDLSDNNSIVDFAKKMKTDFAVIGPEDPLKNGIVDTLEQIGVNSASPSKKMSKLEWSKAYARNILKKHRIEAYPEFHVFSKKNGSIDTIFRDVKKILKDWNNEVAIKPDYLTGGKGVKVWGDHFNTTEEILTYVENVLNTGNKKVVVEQKLSKPEQLKNSEFTLQAFVSGTTVVSMPLVQDYKRAYDDDKGPNTGSMGSYSCANHNLPFLTKSDYNFAIDVMKKTVFAIGGYKGVLYGQFMLTNDGVKLIEFNCRLGDPEAMNVLPLLTDKFAICCKEIIEGTLKQKSWDEKATVCVYLTPKGYPTQPEENKEIFVNKEEILKHGCKLYYASVKEASENSVLTTRSRAIGILGIGDSINEARELAYHALNDVSGDLHYRLDIAERIEN
ncbi:MAG: phosphoribosylamine--glycine ligase [Candidatus Hodarchaeota archaeon]